MVNLKRAKKRIEELQRYVDLTESYTVNSFETAVIKEYAILGSVVKVAEKMNEKGFRMGERRVEPKDISAIVKSKPRDELHQIVRKYLKSKVRRL